MARKERLCTSFAVNPMVGPYETALLLPTNQLFFTAWLAVTGLRKLPPPAAALAPQSGTTL